MKRHVEGVGGVLRVDMACCDVLLSRPHIVFVLLSNHESACDLSLLEYAV